MRDRPTRPKGEGKKEREAKNEHCVAHSSRRTNREKEKNIIKLII